MVLVYNGKPTFQTTELPNVVMIRGENIDLKVCEFVHDSRGFYLFKKAERVERNPHWICRSDYEKGIQAWRAYWAEVHNERARRLSNGARPSQGAEKQGKQGQSQ